MDDGDFVLVEWLVDYRGSPLRSPTNQRNETGKVLMYVSDFLSGRTRAKVHKKDVKALVDGGKAKLVPPSTVLTALPLVTPPAAPSLLPVSIPVALIEEESTDFDTTSSGDVASLGSAELPEPVGFSQPAPSPVKPPRTIGKKH